MSTVLSTYYTTILHLWGLHLSLLEPLEGRLFLPSFANRELKPSTGHLI